MNVRGGSVRETPIEATWAGVRLSGVSVAGRETWFHFPDLGLCFDIGRCPTPLVPVRNVFLSHAHLDHAAGVPYWASQRRLGRLPAGVVRTEPSTVGAWRRLLALHEELEGTRYDVAVEPMPPGGRVLLRKDLSVTSFAASHRVPTLGFFASDVRRKLTSSWKGMGPEVVRAAVARGEQVSEEVSVPIVAFCGDTSSRLFDTAPPEVFRARVLLLECSFFGDEDVTRARDWGHLHVTEVAERADLFHNEVLVLTHLSLRSSPDDIRREVSRFLPAHLARRTVPFLP